ncbi:MAG: metallophosphoesterase [Vampirovibrionales bacterium]
MPNLLHALSQPIPKAQRPAHAGVPSTVRHLKQTRWKMRQPLKALPWGNVHHLAVNHYQVKLPAPVRLESPIRLLQLSDIHYDWFTQDFLEELAPRLQALQPDVIVLTGDFLTVGTGYFDRLQVWLQRLRCLAPCVTVLGNHDYADFAKSRQLSQLLQHSGWHVLVNDAIQLKLNNGQSIALAGLDDFTKGSPDVAGTLALLPPANSRIAKVLLVHNPAQFNLPAHPQTWAGVAHLALCGHTHGGQFRSPHWLSAWLTESPFVKGWHSIDSHTAEGGLPVYISDATGTAGVTFNIPVEPQGSFLTLPVPRWGMLPEVTLHLLHS